MSAEAKSSQIQHNWLQRAAALSLQEGVGLVAMLVILLVVFAVSVGVDVFLGSRNITNLFLQSAIIGMIAVCTTMLMIGGGLDLSVGTSAALVGIIVALAVEPLGTGGAIIVGLLLGLGIGFINGFCVTVIGINPLITTLGMLSVTNGLSFVLSGGLSIALLEPVFSTFGRGNVAGVPVPVIVVATMFVLAYIVMTRTTYGRAMYSIGGNRQASFLAGLPVRRYQIAAYMLCSLSAAIAGIFLASRLGAADPKIALSGLELSVIAAVVLGGTSLAGGKGNLFGTLIGVLILGTLNNGMGLLSVSSYYQQIARGAVLLLAVGLDQLRFTRIRG